MDYDLGYIDLEEKALQPLAWIIHDSCSQKEKDALEG
jgi:hypothetical protein